MRKALLRQLAMGAVLGTLCGAATLAQAAPILWTGLAGDNNWTTGGNWTGNSPPASNGYADQGAEFNAGATAITIPDQQQVSGLKFDTAGWSLSGAGQIFTGAITSNGAGTNSINAIVNYLNGGSTAADGYASPATWHVGTGNTLNVNTMYLNNTTVNLDGGGTVGLTATGVTGWGTTDDVNIENATLNIDSATPYDRENGNTVTGAITLENPGQSFVDLETTVANTESYFGNEIVGNGGTLEATDLGGGFTQVSLVAAPEPGTASLLALATIGGLWRRRRRA